MLMLLLLDVNYFIEFLYIIFCYDAILSNPHFAKGATAC